MATISSVYLDFPEAHSLADLEGIKQDLEWIISAGRAYNEVSKNFNVVLMEAVFAAMLTKYGRVFKGGVRCKLAKEFIESMNQDQKKKHQYFLNLRDKFIAHSVNDWEKNYPAAYFRNLDSENPEFDQIHVQHNRAVSFGNDGIEAIVMLAKYFLEKVNAQFKIEKERVSQLARRIPVDELKKIKPEWSELSEESAGIRRKKKNRT